MQKQLNFVFAVMIRLGKLLICACIAHISPLYPLHI